MKDDCIILQNQTILHMRFIGALLIFIGAFSMAWYFLDFNFIFFQWIDQWGTNIGLMIRAAVVLLGIILYFVGKPSEEE